jgi:hypothetical protein
MTKISDLKSTTGAKVESSDLFVTVSLKDGEFGAKNITRKELVKAIQKEIFDSISVVGGSIVNSNISGTAIETVSIVDSEISDTSFTNGTISGGTSVNLTLENPIFLITNPNTSRIELDDYFLVNDTSENKIVKMTYDNLRTELSRSLSSKIRKIARRTANSRIFT